MERRKNRNVIRVVWDEHKKKENKVVLPIYVGKWGRGGERVILVRGEARKESCFMDRKWRGIRLS